MTAINDALDKLKALKAKSTNPINQEIYKDIINKFGAEGSTLSLDRVVQVIGALAEKRNEIQEYRHVPNFIHYFFQSNGESRRATVKSMIEKIMTEYMGVPDFSDKMKVRVEGFEGRARFWGQSYGTLRVQIPVDYVMDKIDQSSDDQIQGQIKKAKASASLLREVFDKVQNIADVKTPGNSR